MLEALLVLGVIAVVAVLARSRRAAARADSLREARAAPDRPAGR